MTNTHSWVEKCLQELPERKRVVNLDRSFFTFDPVSHRGRIRIERVSATLPDTIICTYIIDGNSKGRSLFRRFYDSLSDDGVIIVVCKNMNPGLMRYWLKPFAWKYIAVIPKISDTCAIAGKGEHYYVTLQS